MLTPEQEREAERAAQFFWEWYVMRGVDFWEGRATSEQVREELLYVARKVIAVWASVDLGSGEV